MTGHRPEITTALVRSLVAGQFPQWRELPVTPVARQGWDNRTFRLGDRLSVRLPSAEGYVAAVARENRWLPELAGHLPLPVPAPVAAGRPSADYPFPRTARPAVATRSTAAATPVRTATRSSRRWTGSGTRWTRPPAGPSGRRR